ncbi:MAG: cysteine desulfurase family protein [Pirellulaceae bacterium]
MIYLDNQATTKCAAEVVAAMLPFFTEEYANPSGVANAFGRRTQERVEAARASIAAQVGCQSSEIVFTSGSTESNNLAINGLLARHESRHIITSQIEHPSVLAPIEQAERRGFTVTRLLVDSCGHVDLNHLAESIRPDTLLVSIMLANNEIGTLQKWAQIVEIVRKSEAFLHTDATQAIGKIPVSLSDLDVDLASFSGHKMHGPKGVGALFIRQRGRRVRLTQQVYGGGQEKGLRSGTLNVPGIVGLEAALELAAREMDQVPARIGQLRNEFFAELVRQIPDLQLNGPALDSPDRLWNNLNCVFPGVEGQTLALACEQVAMSSGSACSAAHAEPSHVLKAIGRDLDEVRSSLRFGLSRFTTAAEISAAAELIVAAYRRLKP